MKKVAFVLLFCFGLLVCSYSQTKQESIKELFQLMKDDSTTTKMMDSMMPVFAKQTSQNKDSTAMAKSKEKMQVLMESVKKIITLVKEEKMRLYDQYFSQEEIRDMIVFYKSPAGRKYVRMTPEISKQIMMKVMKDYVPEIEKAMKEKKGEDKEPKTK